jgi:hypothetical protein
MNLGEFGIVFPQRGSGMLQVTSDASGAASCFFEQEFRTPGGTRKAPRQAGIRTIVASPAEQEAGRGKSAAG